jgi:hypothetical protein
MEHNFLVELDGSSQYTKIWTSKVFLEWFECKILDSGTNLLQWFDGLYPQKVKVHWTIEVVSLWEKISWWAKFLKNWLKKKTRITPWIEEGVRNLLAKIANYGVLWIPSIANVFALSCGDNQGGCGVMHKVQIERFVHIPSTIELAKKTLKMDHKRKTHKQQSIEALACPCEHPSVINFLTIHTKTMEAYRLWCNGELFKKCWITTQNTPPLLIIIPYCNKGAQIWKGEHDLSPLSKIL